MTALADPGPDALAHSQRLTRHIAGAIADTGGWISFARYMELALYAPGLGYYSAGARKFGSAGDFVTAPELSPLFGAAVARQAAQVLGLVGGDILELGAGSGRLALDILRALETSGQMPASYAILEVSPDLRQRQRQLFTEQAPHLLDTVTWLDALPERWLGLVLANEVLDALPVHILHWRDGIALERGVGHDATQGFVWLDRPLSDAELARHVQALPVEGDDYLSEVSLAVPALVRSLGDRLAQGGLLFLDYGFPRREFYHPQRQRGTLMCHYRHHAFDDPFFLPGLTDLTAHVDFTAVADAGLEVGLEVMGYADQAHFLVNCGLLDELAGLGVESPGYAAAATAARKLLSPAEMGEFFKVMFLGKGLAAPPLGFVNGDRRHAL